MLSENQTDTQNSSVSISEESCRSKKPTRFQPACFFVTLLVAVAGISVLSFLMLKTVPDFEKIFNDFDAELPVMTHVVIAASKFFAWFWWGLLLLVPLVLWLFMKGCTFPVDVLNLLSLLFGVIPILATLILGIVFLTVVIPLVRMIADLPA